jgi:hypothetical protein
MKIKRIFHHYQLMEEYQSPMWKVVPPDQREALVLKSAALMIDSKSFHLACVRVLREWPKSCEANLSATVINHQAWIGHASCALNHGAPEDLTRLGWRMLTQEQQDLANAAADIAIEAWRTQHIERITNAKTRTRNRRVVCCA